MVAKPSTNCFHAPGFWLTLRVSFRVCTTLSILINRYSLYMHSGSRTKFCLVSSLYTGRTLFIAIWSQVRWYKVRERLFENNVDNNIFSLWVQPIFSSTRIAICVFVILAWPEASSGRKAKGKEHQWRNTSLRVTIALPKSWSTHRATIILASGYSKEICIRGHQRSIRR